MSVDPSTAGFTFVDANAFAQEIFEVLFSQWGRRVTDPNPVIALANMQYPPVPSPGIPSSVAAVAIGPRSTIDRFWLSYYRQKPFPATIIGTTVYTRFVSLGSPLFFTQGANISTIGTTNDPIAAGLVGAFYLFPRATCNHFAPSNPVTDPNLSTVLPTQYVSGLDGATLLPFDQTVANHEDPYLHVYLYNKPMRFPPGPRFPQMRAATAAIVAAPRRCIAQIPVYGRTRIRIKWVSTTTTTFEVGLLRGLFEVAAENLEQIVSTDTGHTQGSVTLDNPCADYLLLYGTGDAPGTVTYNVAAYDDNGFT